MRPCPQCGAVVPEVEGPVHRYVPSSPGCWMTFGRVQAEGAGSPVARRLILDAYMAQHPGDGSDRRDRQSVFIHLTGLCAVLEQGMAPADVTELHRRLVADRRQDFPVLSRSGNGELTVLHVAEAKHVNRRAREWAQAVWATYAAHHPVIRQALRRS